MATHKFLNLKGWHPTNKWNQKKIFIAEQKAIHRKKAEKEAAEEVAEALEVHRLKKVAAANGNKQQLKNLEKNTMNFMYAAPPGYKKDEERKEEEDEAVIAFKRRLRKRDANFSATAVQPRLEKEAGRRVREGLTLDEQVERFPMLKDAPVEGSYANDVKMNFKPFGNTIRNVRCMRCGEWGHQSGDRECKLRSFVSKGPSKVHSTTQ